MTDTRERIREHVRTNPGVHFNALKRDLDIATGQTQYHLRRLCRGEEVDSEDLQGRTHYFEADAYDAWERRALSLYRRETAREIATTLLEAEKLPAAALAERLGLARSTVSWHASALAEAELIEKAYGNNGRVVLRLRRPEETRRLLTEASPSLPDTLIDRFERLVDASLDGSDES
jgi:predicted transcriptional regulator